MTVAQQDMETDFILESGEVDQAKLTEKLRSTVDYVYANHILVSVNKWDVRFTFADAKTPRTVRPLAGIVMTHLKAKKLLTALKDSLALLEETIGEIKDTPDLPAQMIGDRSEAEKSRKG